MNEGGKFKLTPEQHSSVEYLKRELHKGRKYNDDYIAAETYRKIFASFGDLRGKKIADLGAGLVNVGVEHATLYFSALENSGATLIPIDYIESVKTWNLMRGQEDIKVVPLRASGFNLPLAQESLDGIVSVNLLNLHWSSIGGDGHELNQILLREMFRVLKKDGFAILSTFGYYKYTHNDGQITYNNNIAENEIITASEIRQVASLAGFREISDIALDHKRLSIGSKRLNSDKKPEVKKVEIVEPVALLMKK